jgi:hypothetical protein
VLLSTKQLYILDSYGADGLWNYNELNAPIATRRRVEGQNWPVGYRMTTSGLIQSHFCDCTNLILSVVQEVSDFSVDILNLYMRKMFILVL